MDSTATGAEDGDAFGITESVAADHQQALEAAKPAAAPAAAPEEAPVTQGDEQGEAETPTGEAPALGAPAAAIAEGEEPKPEGEVPPAEGADAPKEKAPIKIGDREFATPEDAIAEAGRVIGRNANIAGELETMKAERDEAVKANLAWQEWKKRQDAGEAPEPGAPAEPKPIDEDALADKVAAKVEERESKKAFVNRINAEIEEISKLPHYAAVYETIKTISDKADPLTGLPFTPKTAYAYALKHHGLSAEAKPAPKPASSAAARAAAARPTGSPAPSAAKPDAGKRDEVNEELADAFPTLK